MGKSSENGAKGILKNKVYGEKEELSSSAHDADGCMNTKQERSDSFHLEGDDSLMEARNIQNALTSEGFLDVYKTWTFTLGLVGALDFIFYCIEKFKPTESVPETILDSLAELQSMRNEVLATYASWWTGITWWNEFQYIEDSETGIVQEVSEIKLSETGDPNQLEELSSQIVFLFTILWVLEAIRAAYSRGLSTAASIHKSRKKPSDDTKARKRQSPIKAAATTFILHILLLPTWWYLARRESAYSYTKEKIYDFLKRFTIKTTIFAMMHPTVFRKRLDTVLNILRWLSFVMPILLKLRTIISYRKRFITTYREHRYARKAHKAIALIWGTRSKIGKDVKVDQKTRENAAAKTIQRAFRLRKAAQKARRDVEKKMRQRRSISRSAALQKIGKNQAALQKMRKSRIEARSAAFKNLRHSKYYLSPNTDTIKELRKNVGKSINVTIQERIEERELEVELEKELEERKRVLILLRPNSLFCTIWAAIVMITIAFDMMLKYLETVLPDMIEEKTGAPHTIETYLKESLLPVPISEMLVCRPVEQAVKPWFCKGLLVQIQSFYIQMAGFVIHEFLLLVGIIMLLDVFVTFCTGVFDRHGALVPPPFMSRWVFGIGLKLLLNPMSKPVAQAALDFALEAGVTRVIRWCIATLLPLMQFLLWDVWATLIQSFNKGTNHANVSL